MPQRRYWNFKDDDATKDINRWLTGLLAPGLYHGFDFNPTANLNLNLVHTSTGIKDVDDTETESGFQGVVITRAGAIIKEDSAITINGVAAGHATLPRIDTIALSHDYIATLGGATALYSIITGTPNVSPVAPALSNANTQIKIGELYIPALTAALNDVGVTFTRSTAPFFAGLDPTSFINGLIAALITASVGDRNYDENNILTDAETVTVSLNKLDKSFGWNTSAKAALNTYIQPGLFLINATSVNRPAIVGNAKLEVYKNGTTVCQIVTDFKNGAQFSRESTNTGSSWSAWVCIKYGQVVFGSGGWNMNTSNNVNPAWPAGYGVNQHNIREVTAMIRSDSEAVRRNNFLDTCGAVSSGIKAGQFGIASSTITFFRTDGSIYDDFAYQDTDFDRLLITAFFDPSVTTSP